MLEPVFKREHLNCFLACHGPPLSFALLYGPQLKNMSRDEKIPASNYTGGSLFSYFPIENNIILVFVSLRIWTEHRTEDSVYTIYEDDEFSFRLYGVFMSKAVRS